MRVCKYGHLAEKGKACYICKKEYSNKYNADNREKLLAYQKEYHEKVKKPKRKMDRENNSNYHQRQKELAAKWYHENRLQVKDNAHRNRLKKVYNLSVEEYSKMLEEQNYVCAICKQPETLRDHRYGVIKHLCVDHNHETGQIRGLLCCRCNRAYGKLEESQQIIENMLIYHKKYSGS